MSKDTDFAVFLRDTVRVKALIDPLTDIRKNPEIKLADIIVSILLMPLYGITSLLGLDRQNRKQRFKRLFGSTRRMLASDSTINRILRWLKPKETTALLLTLQRLFEQKRLSRKQLVADGPYRRIGIVDGSFMGSHYLTALTLHGKIDFPVIVQKCLKRGKELPRSMQMLTEAKQLLGSGFPELNLFDSLYFNQTTFDTVRTLGSHLLIKSDEPFRDVLKDAELLFNAQTTAIDTIPETKGFDYERWCDYSIKVTSEEFAGYSILVAHVWEDYPKRKKDPHVDFWVASTDPTLSAEELREAAHLRWHIENNIFKRLSKQAGTKRFYFKYSCPFFNMLRLFCAAVTIYQIFLYILQRNEKQYKALLDGIKPTWDNIFSRIEETFEQQRQEVFAFG